MSSSISITDRSRTRVGKERLEDSSGVELPILVLGDQLETLVLTKWKTNLMTGPCREKLHSAMRLQVQSSIGIAFLQQRHISFKAN